MVVQQGRAVVVAGHCNVKREARKFSIIIPVLNEAKEIESCLQRLELLRQLGHEVIVVDGGSHDDTVSLSLPLCDRVVQSGKSRSIQMNAGAAIATGDYFMFLHVDTLLPIEVKNIFLRLQSSGKKWGRFDIKLSGQHYLFRIIEKCMNIRSRLTAIATGDQVLFVEKELFYDINGFPEIALMEDVAISKLLLEHSRPLYLRERVVSSSRRWEQNGIIKTMLKMWMLRLLYFFNFDTNRLAKIYS